jgi:hypothetical protein
VDRRSSLLREQPLPIAVDALLRLGVLHSEAGGLPIYVPVHIGSIVWSAEGLFDQLIECELICTSPRISDNRVDCTRAIVRDPAGKTVLELTGIIGHRVGQVIPLRHGVLAAATR